MSIEVLKMALKALENVPIEYDFHGKPMDTEFGEQLETTLQALRQAIEQAEKQKPVAYCHPGVIEEDGTGDWTDVIYSQAQGSYDCPLYTIK